MKKDTAKIQREQLYQKELRMFGYTEAHRRRTMRYVAFLCLGIKTGSPLNYLDDLKMVFEFSNDQFPETFQKKILKHVSI